MHNGSQNLLPEPGKGTSRANNLKRLVSTRTEAEFWKVIRKWTDDKSRPAKVTAQQLKKVFEARLSPVPPSPPHFSTAYQKLYDDMSAAIPARTADHSREQVSSRDISENEIARAKEKLKKHSLRSAVDIDKVAYKVISRIPNTTLAEVPSVFRWVRFTQRVATDHAYGNLKKEQGPLTAR
ncbi:hypothetical protein PM082_018427 [Marasmius tenuissimus]|nr:hypothetical protein PM082_018427 [Marasmius tenuissimus]